MMAEDKRFFTKHGFPKGFRFVPSNLELTIILSRVVHGRRLHGKVAAIFHELNILDYHPQELHDRYERDQEHRFIYFFSYRQHQRTAGAAAGGPAHRKRQRGAGGQDEDENENEPRPVRLAKGGGWKPSGGGQVLRWPKGKGGFVAGKMVTMVFYDHRHDGEPVKSQWGMHEVTIPEDPRLLSKPTKTTRFHELALYRLYKIKSDDMESDYDVVGAGSSNQTPANVAAADGRHFSAPCPAGQPPFGIFTGRNQNQNQPLATGPSTSRMPPLAGGPSTSRMPPPPQHHVPNVGHPHQYYHRQYGFGVAPASTAHQRVHTMTTMSPAPCATGMPGRQMLPFARPPGRQFLPFATPPSTGLPGRQSLQFARPPAPSSQMPVPLTAGNLASHHQAPAKATYGVLDELAPMTAGMHVGAGQEAGSGFGATRSSPATGSRPAGQDATVTTTEPGQHVQFAADCSKAEKVPPQIEDTIPTDNYDGIGMLNYDIDLGMFEFDERFQFTMDELCPTLDDTAPTQQGDGN